ncbi:MAG TPA: hypothetical protein VK623_11490 [Flavobacterium sp.]|nr:hypothetical protein [Flavobacterium sp.]
MDSFILGEDIKVMYVTAANFPDGIPDAFDFLNSLVPDVEGRRFFGISAPDESGKIIYKAAAEELFPGETQNLKLESFTIKHGAYMSFYIKDYRNHIDAIKEAFELLLGQQEADPNGYCLEWYIGDDVKCLVPSGPENYPG